MRLAPCTSDKREKRIILTESGREYSKKLIEPLLKAEDRASEMIGSEKMKAMCETLELFNLLFERELNGGLGNE